MSSDQNQKEFNYSGELIQSINFLKDGKLNQSKIKMVIPEKTTKLKCQGSRKSLSAWQSTTVLYINGKATEGCFTH